MIRPLRRLHVRLWIVLAAAVSLLLGAALLARRPATPVNANWEPRQ